MIAGYAAEQLTMQFVRASVYPALTLTGCEYPRAYG